MLFFAFITGLVLEFRFVNEYLDRPAFFRVAGIVAGASALVLGGLAAWRFGKGILPSVQLGLATGLVTLLVAPWFLSLSNRLAVPTAAPREVEFVEEQAHYGSRFGESKYFPNEPNQYHLFFYLDNRLYKVISEQPHFPEAEKGEVVTIPLRYGRWGFDWVDW